MSETKEGMALQAELEEFFEKFGSIVSVRMRRYDPKHPQAKKFKGSVFAEFEKPEEMKKFLELDPKPKFKEDGEPLLTMSKCVELTLAPACTGDSLTLHTLFAGKDTSR